MKSKLWAVFAAFLAGSGLFFVFALTGHKFLGTALILAAAIIVVYRFAGKKLTRVMTALIAAALIAFAAVETPIIAAAATDAPSGCEYIIVLGAGLHGTTPSLSLTDRLEAALEYLEENPETKAIVSGGQGPGENMTEAEAMGIWLEARGIAPERIIEEREATSTAENLEYSFGIILDRGDEPDAGTAIVTSEYHLYRAKLMAKDMGVEVSGIAGHTSRLTLMINYFIREAFAAAYYWIFGA